MQNQSGKFTVYKYTVLMQGKKKSPLYAWTDKLIPKRYPRSRSVKWGSLLLLFLALITLQKRLLVFPLLLSLRDGGWQCEMDVLLMHSHRTCLNAFAISNIYSFDLCRHSYPSLCMIGIMQRLSMGDSSNAWEILGFSVGLQLGGGHGMEEANILREK